MDQINIQHISLIAFPAIALIVLAQVTYIRDTYRRIIRPSILSWIGWSLLMGTSLVSQIVSKGWEWSLTGLLISILGCLSVALLSFIIKNFSLQKSDWLYLIAGCFCMVIYLLTKNPWLTTIFAIASDFMLAIPTFLKAWKNSSTEKTPSWIFGFVSWTLTTIISLEEELLYTLWPIYLLGFNGTMLYLTYFRK